LRKTFQPAILVECGFISNPMEAERLSSFEFRQDIAEALARGVAQYRNRLRKIEARTTLARADVE
jgi:N-acetylmuramoyl-L-alanine amidase